MKVVLVDPPWHRLFGSHYNGLPLGICYISSYLNVNNIECSVLNGDFKNSNTYQSQYDRLNSYDEYIKTLSDINKPIWNNTVDSILNQNPDVVGISINQVTLKSALNISKLIKEQEKNIDIVFGGPYITITRKLFGSVDGIIVGEGEEGLLSYCKKPRKIIISDRIDDLNKLPFPDREHLLFNGKYIEYGHLITGRGCPFNCIFCASKKIWNGGVRLRSMDNVVTEMNEISNKYNCNKFLFRDDTFTINKKRTLDFCNKIRKNNYEWQCDTRIDNLSYNVLKSMKDSGCYGIKIGVESGSDRMLSFINKKITKDKVRQVVKDSKQIGIDITTYFIVGLPTETNEEVKETIDFIKEIDPDNVSVSLATPYCGTLLENTMNIDSNHMEKYFHQSPELLKNLNVDYELIEEIFNISHNQKQKTIY